MGKRLLGAGLLAVSLACAGAGVQAEQIFDLGDDFSATANPNGAWSYGWSASTGSSFFLDTSRTSAFGLDVWQGRTDSDSFGNPSVSYNGTGSDVVVSFTSWQPGAVALHPGPDGENSVVRWTAPAPGRLQVRAGFEGRSQIGTTTDAHVLLNGVSLFNAVVEGFGTPSAATYVAVINVFAGDRVDFSVGYGLNGSYGDDTTQLTARLVLSPIPEPSVAALLAVGLVVGVGWQRRRT